MNTTTSSILIDWVFNGTTSTPPEAWTPEATLTLFTHPTPCFPNQERVRRSKQTNLVLAASAAGRVDFLSFFHTIHNVDLTQTTVCDVNIFHQALDGATVRYLLSAELTPENERLTLRRLASAPCDTGSTPLHFASHGKHSALQALLEVGCFPLVRNNGKSIPLHYAGGRQSAELLIQYGGEASVNAMNSLGDTPLHLAISHGFTDVVLVLLRHNADVSLPSQSLSRWDQPMTIERLLCTLESTAVSQQESQSLAEIKMLLQEDESTQIKKIFLPFRFRHSAWVGLRTLCRKPRKQISMQTGCPAHIIEEIISIFLGPFPGGCEALNLINRTECTEQRNGSGGSHRSSCVLQ